jgi:NAD(P)-dependent dehydrogenase (short-subunit alcohol dehydrogenase family)
VVVTTRAGKGEATTAAIAPFVAEGGKVEAIVVDLGSFASIRAGVSQFEALGLPLHVLVNNAGVMMCPKGQTSDGIETQFGVSACL